MEEAESLCRRIGIMVDGRLACLGCESHHLASSKCYRSLELLKVNFE